MPLIAVDCNELPQGRNNSKTLVVYYSASGTTEKIADYIVEAMNADTFVITPVQPYSDADLDWTDQTSRVVMEHNDENRHDHSLLHACRQRTDRFTENHS